MKKLQNVFATVAVLSVAAATPVFATSTTNFFAADYGSKDLLEYSASIVGGQEVLTHATPIATFSPPSGGSITEGVSGTLNTVLTIDQTSSGSYEIARYSNSGTFINYVGGGSTTFKGVGSFAVTNDAQTMYVADQSGNELYEVSLKTGAELNKVSLNQVHDVAILKSGQVIAEDLGGGIEEYNPDLSGATNLIAIGAQGAAEPSSGAGNLQGNNQYGFAIDPSGNIWTVTDNRSTGAPLQINDESGTVYEFSSTGQFLNSWTLTNISGTLAMQHDYVNNSTNLPNIDNAANNPYAVGTFGISFGPDGNLYLADIGGVVLGDNPATGDINGGNNVGEFNTTTDQFSVFIQGDTSGTIDASTGLSAPKYVNWQSDFAPNPDPGVPEPSGVVTATTFAGLLGALVFGAKIRLRSAVNAK